MRGCLLALVGAVFLSGLCGCGDQIHPDDRYGGPVAVCEVELSSEQPSADDLEPARASSAPDYWKPGPYAAWNTSPGLACPGDPVIERVGEQRDVALYVTYPAASRPTYTGRGDVAPGRWPVIVFAHANNDTQCEIYRRYYSLHDHWASWGFVVASVDGTHTNCEPGSKNNIEDRVAGQLAALDKLAALDAHPDSRFFGRLDLDRVVFAGHSRGGGSSLVAAKQHGRAEAVIDLQGIDLTSFGFGSQTLPDFPVLGMTAGRDVDLDYPLVEPTEDQLGGPYTWVNINGGIHAYSADTVPIEPDDTPRITRSQQHDITEYYSTAFLARWVGVADGRAGGGFEPRPAADAIVHSHGGAETVGAEISERGVYSRWRSEADMEAETVWIDRFDGSTPAQNLTGGRNTSSGLTRSEEVATYQPDKPNPHPIYRKAISRLLVAEDTGHFRLELTGGVELSAGATLQARVKGPDEGEVADFAVVVELADGTTERFDGGEHIGPETLDNRFVQLVVPVGRLAGSSDESMVAVEVELSDGALFVDDLRVVR